MRLITIAKAELELQIERVELCPIWDEFLEESIAEQPRVIIREEEEECFNHFDLNLLLLA